MTATTNQSPTLTHNQLAASLTKSLSQFGQVQAVALGGSSTTAYNQPDSDIDVYVYVKNGTHIDTKSRKQLLLDRGVKLYELNNRFWETGDEWQEPSGVFVDLMYREQAWIEQQLENVLVKHEASVGYSTCFWFNILHSTSLYDRTGWFSKLKDTATMDYPDALRDAIIAKNYPLLRQVISSYKNQLEKAYARADVISLNHRSSAFLASYFDIIFALNKLPHPGEKRLLQIMHATCEIKPRNANLLPQFLEACAHAHDSMFTYLDQLVDEVDTLISSLK
jgi:predicted nucleotidyltransferase